MRPLKPFTYFEPETIEKAVQTSSNYGKKAKILAGGVDLLTRIRLRQIKPEYVVSLQRIPGLDYIKRNGAGLSIGAMTTLRSIELSPVIQRDYVILHEAIDGISSIQVKNMGTAVGNLCVATPASDIAAVLYALGAKVRIAGTAGERTIPVESLFVAVNQTSLEPGEIAAEIMLPSLPDGTGAAFMRLVRAGGDVAKVNVAVTVTISNNSCQEARIALGSVAPTVIRSKKAEEILKDKLLDQKTIEAAAEAAAGDAKPINDIRSTAEYRREATKVLVRRAIIKAGKRAET